MNKALIAAAALVACGISGAAFAEEASKPSAVKNRSIGYVMTAFHYAVQTSDNKAECPQGLNDGPREQYSALFPKDGTKRSVTDTDLFYESRVWFPSTEPEQFTFKEPVSKIAPGINLDGKVGANDFESPEGEKGIDNQMYRMMGCIEDYRPGGSLYHFTNYYMRVRKYMRVVIELTNVDSLVNDDDVTLTTYRGLDYLFVDASGNNYLPYGTQKLDQRWGKDFIRTAHGKIVNGVLTTEPAEMNLPYHYAFNDRGVIRMHGAQLKLKITDEQANGLWGGYIDTESWYRSLNEALGTHSLSYGRQAAPSMYRALNRLADGYPDPKTGKNTAISSAIDVSFRQVFIERDSKPVASNEPKNKDVASLQQ